MAYHIRLFGKLSIAQGDEAVPLPARSDARLLLAYLLVYRQRIHLRETLLGILWPDLSEMRARRALSQALWQVRRCLPDVVQADHDSIQIPPESPIWVDVTEFESLVESHLRVIASDAPAKQELEKAIQLYQGDLLEGFFAEWVLEERRRLREKCLHALESLVQLDKAAGRYQNALDMALILATADPLRETAHREVMRLYYFLNRPQAALQQYEICRHILETELKVEPEAETTNLVHEIYRQVNQPAASSSKPRVPYLPVIQSPADLPITVESDSPIQVALIGREAERGQLLQHVEAIFHNTGGLALVEGEAGVGKTRLAQEIARDAEWRGAQVLWGRGREREPAAHDLIIEALADGLSPLRVEQLNRLVDRRWLDALNPFLPTLSPSVSDSAPSPAEYAEALGELLTGWAQITPVLIILEDLHWAGEEVAALLAQLGPRLRNSGVLCLGTYRGEEVRNQPQLWERMQALDRLGLQARLRLSGLDLESTGELIGCALGLGRLAPDLPARIFEETGGNPLFILETLRVMHHDGLLKRDSQGEWRLYIVEGEGLPLAPAVENVIAQRLRQLPSTLRQALNSAAVLGYYFDPTLLIEVSGLDSRTALTALKELAQRQLVSETPQDYRFSHDKVRQIAYNDLLMEERLWLHSRVAQALEHLRPGRLDLLAYHFAAAEGWDQAMHYHRRAGEQARFVQDFFTAVEHFTSSLASADNATSPSDSERFEVLAAREAAHGVLGNRQAQTADLEAMALLARTNPERRIETLTRRARLLARLDHRTEAEAAAREALALAEEQAANSSLAVKAHTALGWVFLERHDPDQAMPHLQMVNDVSPGMAEMRAAIDARNALALNLRGMSQYADAREQAERAFAAYVKWNDSVGQADVLVTLGGIAFEQGLADESRIYFQRALDFSRAVGYRQREADSLLGLGDVFNWHGPLPEALKSYETALETYRGMEQRGAEMLARAKVAGALLSAGEVEKARQECETVSTYARDSGNRFLQGLAHFSLAKCARQRNEYKSARGYLDVALEALDRNSNQRAFEKIQVYLELAYVALDQSEPETAQDHVSAADAICRQHDLQGFAPFISAARGLALLALKQPEAALASTETAMSKLSAAGGRACAIPFAHYRVLNSLGQIENSRAALEQAHQMLMSCLAGFSTEQRQRAVEGNGIHRAIAAAWESIQPQRATMRLPRVNIPLGRPVRENEWVEVNWTIAEPDDEAISDRVARRRHRLLRLLREAAAQNAAPTYEYLAEALDASVRTIADDIAALRARHSDLPETRRKARR